MILNKSEYKSYLNKDALANGIKYNFSYYIRSFFVPDYKWKYLKTLRKVEYLTNCHHNIIYKPLTLYFKLKLRRLGLKLNYSIPINVFGPGLSLPHYGTIVVNPKSRIGSFCRLHTCVNIGASSGNNKAPIIGDNCYIGPSVVIFGDIQISDNVTIGANSTVNKSILDHNVVIAGTPAKIVKVNVNNWLTFNRINL